MILEVGEKREDIVCGMSNTELDRQRGMLHSTAVMRDGVNLQLGPQNRLVGFTPTLFPPYSLTPARERRVQKFRVALSSMGAMSHMWLMSN